MEMRDGFLFFWWNKYQNLDRNKQSLATTHMRYLRVRDCCECFVYK